MKFKCPKCGYVNELLTMQFKATVIEYAEWDGINLEFDIPYHSGLSEEDFTPTGLAMCTDCGEECKVDDFMKKKKESTPHP